MLEKSTSCNVSNGGNTKTDEVRDAQEQIKKLKSDVKELRKQIRVYIIITLSTLITKLKTLCP